MAESGATRGGRLERIRVLRANFQKEFYTDTGGAVGLRIFANDFSEVFTVGGAGIVVVRHDQKEAHANFIACLGGVEVNAAARDADALAHIVEMDALGVRGPNAHELREFAATSRAALGGASLQGSCKILVHADLKASDKRCSRTRLMSPTGSRI